MAEIEGGKKQCSIAAVAAIKECGVGCGSGKDSLVVCVSLCVVARLNNNNLPATPYVTCYIVTVIVGSQFAVRSSQLPAASCHTDNAQGRRQKERREDRRRKKEMENRDC